MTSFVQRLAYHVRQNLGDLLGARLWRDLALTAALIGSAIPVAWVGTRYAWYGTAGLAAIWIGAWAYVFRQGWLRMLGPVFLYDLVRIARHRRYLFVRAAYALFLLLILTTLYEHWSWNLPQDRRLTHRELSAFAETFFFTFVCVEFVAVLVLTPVYVAGAVAEEKDKKTLEFLLATDLDKREIILSKLLARLANLFILILIGLPILGFTQFFGGIDPNLVLIGFAILGLTILSLGALSILHSIYAEKPRTAILLTYLTTIIYFGLGCLGAEFLPQAPGVANWGPILPWDGHNYPLTVAQVVEWLNTGNIVVALHNLVTAWKNGQAITAIVPGLVRRYALFHGITFLVCTVWATGRLRHAAFAGQATILKERSPVGRPWRWLQFEVNPLLWKELAIEPGLGLGRLARWFVIALAIASFMPAVSITADYFLNPSTAKASTAPARYTREIQAWVQLVGTLVACSTVLAVAVRAAGSISGERDRQTLDSLLTTPLNRDEILYSKWLASILSVRSTWLWLGGIWIVGAAALGISVFALPLLIWAWIVYAMFAASLGLWFSLLCQNTFRATLATVLTLFGLGCGHWLIWGCCVPFLLYSPRSQREIPEWLVTFQASGLTPPLTWKTLAFQLDDLRQSLYVNYRYTNRGMGELVSALAGLCCYGVGATFLWRVSLAQFRKIGVGQPVHLGLFPGNSYPFPSQTSANPAGAQSVSNPGGTS